MAEQAQHGEDVAQPEPSGRAGPAGQPERPQRELGRGVAGPRRLVYAAGVLALTEPGPAAAGMVITDEQGRMLSQRAHYVGQSTRREAAAQALLGAARLAAAGGLEAPVFRIDDQGLAEALRAATGDGTLSALREVLRELPGYRLEVVPAAANRALAVALTPLIDWLPDRTRRSEGLHVRSLGEGRYEVESESEPGRVYHVTLRPPGTPGSEAADAISCECADFLYRGIPCKHLFAVTGGQPDQRLLLALLTAPPRRA
jgi:hypothetical protein